MAPTPQNNLPDDPDEDEGPDDNAPDTDPFPAPPKDGNPGRFEAELGGEG